MPAQRVDILSFANPFTLVMHTFTAARGVKFNQREEIGRLPLFEVLVFEFEKEKLRREYFAEALHVAVIKRWAGIRPSPRGQTTRNVTGEIDCRVAVRRQTRLNACSVATSEILREGIERRWE